MAPRSTPWNVVSAALAFNRARSDKTVSLEALRDDHPLPDDVFIAVMGVTGAGKSTFIKTVTQRDDIKIGDTLTSETIDCKAYSFTDSGVRFAIVDTPGFNDTKLDEADILSNLANFMEQTYRANVKFTAIIYIHPITNDRFDGAARNNFRMFMKLCGPDYYSNVVLATSMWTLVDEDSGRRREHELAGNPEFWGEMISNGSQIIRLPDDRDDCIDLLLKLAGKERLALKIQEELVDQQLPIDRTEAAGMAQNVSALQKLDDEFHGRLAALEEEHRAQMLKKQADYERIQAELVAVFKAEMQKQHEQLEQAREANAIELQEAEERRGTTLEGLRKLIERAKLDTENVRAEVEQLTLRKTIESTARAAMLKRRNAHEKAVARQKHIDSQFALVITAIKDGTIKAKHSIAFEDVARPYCSECGYRCDAQLSYSCTQCEDFDLCSQCATDCPSCFDGSHTSFARRSFVGAEHGQCRRTHRPIQERYRVPCDHCGTMFNPGSLAFHCCSCKNDSFELCLDCVIRGQTCADLKHHTLRYMIM